MIENPGKSPQATQLARDILALNVDWTASNKNLTIDFDLHPVPALIYVGAKRDLGLGWVGLLGFLWYLHLNALPEFWATHTTDPGGHLLQKAIDAGLIVESAKGISWDHYLVGADPKPLLEAIAA